MVKVQAVPSSDQYQNHQLFLSDRERSTICKPDRMMQVEKAESFLCPGIRDFYFLFSMYSGGMDFGFEQLSRKVEHNTDLMRRS